jgi:hypothetical protein
MNDTDDIITNESTDDIITNESTDDIITNESTDDIITNESTDDIITNESTENDIITKKKVPKIKELCFSGGHYGSLLTFTGALQSILENNYYDISSVERYVGTSSGAILSFALGFGYKLDTIIYIFKHLKTEEIFQTSSQMFLYLFDDLGLYDTKKLKDVFEVLIEEKGHQKNITFQEFYSKTNIDLCFTTYCLNTKKLLILNYIFTPNLEISKAITMSMAIPIICKPISYMNQLYIDPCLICNFPIDYVKNDEYLGFSITPKKKYEEKITFLSLLKTIYYSIYDEFMNLKVHQYNDERVFLMPCDKNGDISFNITIKEINKLIFEGKKNFTKLYEENNKSV